jgi:hypothetical protein
MSNTEVSELASEALGRLEDTDEMDIDRSRYVGAISWTCSSVISD